MSYFHNGRERFVPDLIDSLVMTEEVERLDIPEGHVLIRAGASPSEQVAVISGGGSGHEPAHAGFLGEGMLTAAVPGSLFASPPVGAILAAIRAVTGTGGCLLIIKNYTGDRLNFGLAAERARAEGLDVRTVLMGDDVALPDHDQPRGLAGTVLVHKVAGHLAATGASLDEVTAAAERTAGAVSTIGLALGPATMPTETPQQGGQEDSRGAELGLGIHNEPGARAVDIDAAHQAVGLALDALSAPEILDAGGEAGVVAVLNDLGGCSPQENLILTRELLTQLGVEHIRRLVGPAPLMTSLDMHGFSVSLLPATDELLAALDAPTTAPGWPGVRAPRLSRDPVRVAEGASSSVDSTEATADGVVEAAVMRGGAALTEARTELDELDRVAGDGDAGETFSAGAAAIAELIDSGELGFAEPAPALRQVASKLEGVMGGSSGVLLAILFTAMARSFDEQGGRAGGAAAWAAALEEGIAAMQHHGGASEGDRTMLDALLPAQRALATGSLADAVAAAEQGAQSTAGLEAKAGRAAYVPGESIRGKPDAGAVAVTRFLTALLG